MTGRIVYGTPTRYFLGDREVSEAEFNAADPDRSRRLRDMFATGQAPQSNTDREFLAGHCNGNQFAGQPWAGDYYRSVAESQGCNTAGKVYLSQLAAYPGDPRAWVSGKGDAQRVLEERGLASDGLVKARGRPLEREPEEVGLDPDIIDEVVESRLREHPAPETVDVQEMREQVFEERKPFWVKRKTAPPSKRFTKKHVKVVREE